MKELQEVGFKKSLPAGGTKYFVLLLLHTSGCEDSNIECVSVTWAVTERESTCWECWGKYLGLTGRSDWREGGVVVAPSRTAWNNGRWEMLTEFLWRNCDHLWHLDVQKSGIKVDLEGKEWEWTGSIWLQLGTSVGYLWMWSRILCFRNTRRTAAVPSNFGHTQRYRDVWWCVTGLVAIDV